MSRHTQTMQKPKGGMLSALLQIIVLVAFIAAGWFLRGLLPGGAPAGGMPGGPGGPGEANATVPVETVIVVEGSSQAPQEFIGRVESIQSVDITAQISGYISQVHFAEGSAVQQGDLLFTIEQEPYIARVALAEASLGQAKADLAGAKADVAASQAALDSSKADMDHAEKYLKRLQSADKRSIVEANLDSAVSDEKQARARVQETEARYEQANATIQQMEALIQKTQADLNLAKINLGYTDIHSPITGRIGKAMLTKGNYVSPSLGALAHVAQLDPVRVVFSMSDREYISVLQEIHDKPVLAIQTFLRLPNGTQYEGFGEHDFDDNKMNSHTGTISVYARFDNPDGFLIPNSYITVMLRHEDAEQVPIVPQESILSEGGQDYVYIVDANDAVEKRKVTLGPKIDDYQCVSAGLQLGEKVVSQGLQKIKPGQKVAVAAAPAKGDA